MIKDITIKFIWLLFIGFTLHLLACQPKEETLNSTFLFGEWKEKESEEIALFSGSNHTFEFTKDTFFLKRYSWTEGNLFNDCLGYTDYFKGTYKVAGNKLFLDGQVTYIDGQITSLCNTIGIGAYEDAFEYIKEGEEVLILNPSEEVYNQIRLERQ